MTNPQKENGYTPICNELLEVIYESSFNATQLKIIMVVCRYTYGFSRKEHSMSETFIANAVKVSKRYISSELNKLVELKVISIIKPHTDTSPRTISLNKHYDEWLINRDARRVNNPSTVTYCSTDEEVIGTTVEQSFQKPVEQFFYQDKQGIKQNLKQDNTESEILWGLYPNKSGKVKAMSKIPGLVKKYGLEKMKLSISKYIEDVKAKRKTFPGLNYKDGSTFFNGAFEDYINKENIKAIPREKLKIVVGGYLE